MSEEKTLPYVLVASKHFDKDGNRLEKGTKVNLTASQAEAWKDRFVLQSVLAKEAEALALAAEAKTEDKKDSEDDTKKSETKDEKSGTTAQTSTDKDKSSK